MTPQTPLSATRRVLTAVLEGTPPDAWAAGAARVEDERTSIDRLLASTPLPRIYGFTTLLGHLDDHRASAEDQWTLLDAHLVGTPTRQTAAFGQLLAACKIEQASHGGSGMSPAAFDALRDRAIDTQTGIAGAWTASYGAGDVVPGAWLARDALARRPRREFAAGDVIALINGHHISTAIALLAAARATHELAAVSAEAAILTASAEFSEAAGAAHPDDETRTLITTARTAAGERAARPAPDAQAPISQRDARPLIAGSLAPLRQTVAGIEARLSAPSANPLFAGEPLRAHSQSGFLDLTLTHALTALQQSLHLAAGLWQRFIVRATANAPSDDPARALVQPAKVAQAVVERMASMAALPSRFTGTDSEGVEDVRDLSLHTAVRVLELVDLCAEIRSLASRVPGLEAEPPRPFTAAFVEASWGPHADARIADSFAREASLLVRPQPE